MEMKLTKVNLALTNDPRVTVTKTIIRFLGIPINKKRLEIYLDESGEMYLHFNEHLGFQLTDVDKTSLKTGSTVFMKKLKSLFNVEGAESFICPIEKPIKHEGMILYPVVTKKTIVNK
jgi:hypothetical protein